MVQSTNLEQSSPASPDQLLPPDSAETSGHTHHRLGRWAAGIVLGSTYLGLMHGLSSPAESSLAGIPIEVQTVRGSENVLSVHPLGGLDFGQGPRVGSFKIGTETSFSGDFDIGSVVGLTGVSSPESFASYLQLYSNLDASIETIKTDVEWHVGQDALAGFGVGLAANAALLLAAKRMSRRRKDGFSTALEAKPLTTAGLVLGISALTVTGSYFSIPAQNYFNGVSIESLQGTALANVKMSGTLATGTKTLAPLIRQTIVETTQYAHEATQNFAEAFAQSGIKPPDDPAVVTIVAVADRHCADVMDKVTAMIAKAYRANIVVSAGDDDISGISPLEQICTGDFYNQLHNITKDGLIAVAGNHDSNDITAKYEKQQGFSVLEDDKIITRDGITFMGSRDPERSIFMQPNRIANGKTEAEAVHEQAEATVEAACANPSPVDIAVLHHPQAGKVVAESGCARLTLSGHVHTLHDPESFEAEGRLPSYFKILGTAGGADSNTITIGRPHKDATVTIIRYNKAIHEPVSESNVIIHTDGTVEITPFTPYAQFTEDRHHLLPPPSPVTDAGTLPAAPPSALQLP